MSKQLKARTKLFDVFSKQLHLLKDNGLLNIELKYQETYICPLCLEQFQKSDLISKDIGNYLTEEDAPPAKLNGSRVALTCHNCNSKAGHEIDHHLIHRIREIDDSKFHTGTVQKARFEIDNTIVNSQITSEGNGILKVLHRIDNNNPSSLDKFIHKLKSKSIGELLNMSVHKKIIDDTKVDKALLKANYIITFSKFGYIFLLDNYYNEIRNEIRQPDLPTKGHLFINNQFSPNQVGTYYVCNPNAKSILNVFTLKTEYSETVIGAIIPFPNKSSEDIHRSLVSTGERIGSDNVGVVLDTTNYDINVDLFRDIAEIKKIIKWIN